jgi:hypothetical protein
LPMEDHRPPPSRGPQRPGTVIDVQAAAIRVMQQALGWLAAIQGVVELQPEPNWRTQDRHKFNRRSSSVIGTRRPDTAASDAIVDNSHMTPSDRFPRFGLVVLT